MIATLPQLDVTRLAADYSAAVRAELSPIQLANVQRRNSDAAPGVDHVHEYIDPADALHSALANQLAPGFSEADHGDAIAIATPAVTGFRGS